jgi:outer membrane lipoprotein carrier protein
MIFMSRYLFAACAALLLLCAPAFAAQQAALEDILAALKKGYASMDDLQADFSQRTYVATLKREEKGSGALSLKKKGGSAMFRFNYVRPKQQIISNGKSVWYYLPENRQVILTDTAKLFSGGNGMAMSYLTGLGNLDADFTIKLLTASPDKKGNYQLELVPKKQNSAVAKLHLFVSAAAVDKSRRPDYFEAFFPITASVLFDQLGNRTTIEYSRIRVNGGVTSERFSFKAPAGVDVIKQ